MGHVQRCLSGVSPTLLLRLQPQELAVVAKLVSQTSGVPMSTEQLRAIATGTGATRSGRVKTVTAKSSPRWWLRKYQEEQENTFKTLLSKVGVMKRDSEVALVKREQ